MVNKILNKLNSFLTQPRIEVDSLKLGKNVHIGKNVVFKCKSLEIGDGCTIMDNVIIESTHCKIGDYATIYQNCHFTGPGTLTIGHNFWLGSTSIIDSQGDTIIGNNVGIGAHSQLWGHMVYGDVSYGCQFDSVKKLVIEDDVWLVGHNLVSPVRIGTRAMALLGSLITKDLQADRSYAGNPAIDVTEKIGSQISVSDTAFRRNYLEEQIASFSKMNKIEAEKHFQIHNHFSEDYDKNKTSFFLENRLYHKTNSKLEYKLIKYLLPRAKYLPINTKK